MFENFKQKLNKSFSSTNSPEKTQTFVNKLNMSQSTTKPITPEKSKINVPPEKPKPVCKLCKGAGCCIRCNRKDDWEDMIWCANKTKGTKHGLLHYSCDNLTPDMVKCIKHYYCPSCRLDEVFQVSFYKKASTDMIDKINNVLNVKPSPKHILNSENITKSKSNSISECISTTTDQVIPNSENIPVSKNTFPANSTVLNPVNGQILSPGKAGTDTHTEILSPGNTDPDPDTAPTDSTLNSSSASDASSQFLSGNEYDSFAMEFPGQVARTFDTNATSRFELTQNTNNDESIVIVNSQKSIDYQKPICNFIAMNEFRYIKTYKEDKIVNNFFEGSESQSEQGKNQDSSPFIQRSSLSENKMAKDNEILKNLVRTLNDKLKTKINDFSDLESKFNGLTLENDELKRENFRFELEVDEAVAIVNEKENELDNTKVKLNIMENQNLELTKPLNIDPREMYQFPQKEVFSLYKKQSVLLGKQTNQIKQLLGEKQLYKKTLTELETENKQLRSKVVDLTEEDINRKILDFTIEENNRLKRKINFQRERTIKLGQEIKKEMKDCDSTKEENQKLKQQIKSLEKILKEKSSGNEEWETTSESSVKSLNMDKANITSPNSKGSVEKLLIQALQSLGIDNRTKDNKNSGETKSTENKNTEPREKTNYNPRSRADSGPPSKTICKYFLQNRCKFSERCYNIHPKGHNVEKNYIPPWSHDVVNPNLGPYQQPIFNSRSRDNLYNPGYRQSPERGRQSGYWSLPPLTQQNRFSPLSEMNLDMHEFVPARH